MKRLLVPLLIVVVGTALCVRASVNATYGSGYAGSALDRNRTGDAVQALAELDFKRFFATQPAIGPVSLIVRAPFAALAGVGHDLVRVPARYGGAPPIDMPKHAFESQLRLYRFGIFPCLMGLVILAAFASRALALRARRPLVQLLVAGTIFVMPLWDSAITLGHPDEFLTTALTLGAVLAAVRHRFGWAGVLLGLGLASKQWAILALPAILLAVPPPQMKKTVAITIGVYLALTLPMVAGNADRFFDAITGPSIGSHGPVGADTIWFRLAPHHDKHVFDGVTEVTVPARRLPHVLESAIHPFTVMLAIGLAALYWYRRKPDAAGIFNLLALVFLLRCMLDPVTNDYYHAPLIVALALYEGFSRRQFPVLALIVSATFIPRYGIDLGSLERANAIYLAWSVPLAVWLTFALYRQRTAPAQPLRPKL